MNDNIFLKKYFNNFNKLVEQAYDENFIKIIELKKLCIQIKKNKKKIIIIGNGGSAAISSHFSVDLTKNSKIRSINFNESDLITCFANDYGYKNWAFKALDYYSDRGDLLILISSSGESLNLINAARFYKKNKIGKLVTFTGHRSTNSLKKYGDLNFWVNSKSYNLIENIHQFLLLSTVDLIIGKENYSSKR